METATSHPGQKVIDPIRSQVYFWTLAVILLAILCSVVLADRNLIARDVGTIGIWIATALLADLLIFRVSLGAALSMSLSITLAAAMILTPTQAAIVAFCGCLDPMELRGESSASRILFNRAQVAISTLAAAAVFRIIGVGIDNWPLILVVSVVALAADFSVNGLLVVGAIGIKYKIGPLSALRRMFGSAPTQSSLLYVSLGLLAPVVAVLYVAEGPWGLVACLIPLALARATLVDAERLQNARARLELKDHALREATEQVAEERRDERMVLAGELHDTVLPALFKVHLMGQVIRQDLASGRLLELDNDIPELIQATTVAQSSVRRIVSNLRRSPIGPGGLLPSIEALARQLEVSGATPFSMMLSEVGGSDRAQLVIYQVAREAMTNAARYARADLTRVELWSDDGLIRLLVSDDGRGFEVDRPRPADHFGLELMRERVEAVGGSLVVSSQLGEGTSVSVVVPPDA